MPDFRREFGLDTKPSSAAANLAGNLVTTMQAGAIAGALLSSPYADRWGRKSALLAVAVTGFVGGIMQAFSYGHFPVFYIGRYLFLAISCMLSWTWLIVKDSSRVLVSAREPCWHRPTYQRTRPVPSAVSWLASSSFS